MLTQEEADLLLEEKSLDNKIKILVVEDDPITKLLYEKGLFNQIFDKRMVVSGKEALVVYNDWQPEIIVLDIYLPEMTGYQVLKKIRKTIGDKKTTIVMATGLRDRQDVLSCTELGVEGYIVKPFQSAEIALKILYCHAKKEPERVREAETMCKEILKLHQARMVLDQDTPKAKEDTGTAVSATPNSE
jgi:DNA-binding response OmpR family regulator